MSRCEKETVKKEKKNLTQLLQKKKKKKCNAAHRTVMVAKLVKFSFKLLFSAKELLIHYCHPLDWSRTDLCFTCVFES